MKYFLLLAIACMFSVLGVAQTATDTTYVEILYFHGRQRCVTCKAIEEHTKEVVNTDLAEWVKNGKLRFKEVDISTPEGEKLAEKYNLLLTGGEDQHYSLFSMEKNVNWDRIL